MHWPSSSLYWPSSFDHEASAAKSDAAVCTFCRSIMIEDLPVEPSEEPSPTPSLVSGDLPAVLQCQICLEDMALDDTTIALTKCGHRFCGACITAFLNVQITDGCVELVCFHTTEHQSCGVPIDVRDIEQLVTADMFIKYERFRLLRTNPQARECPFCRVVHVTTASKEQPEWICPACTKPFCFVHADAHRPEESCVQFEKRQSKRERQSGRIVRKISRPCPQCGQPIQKNGGCVHMTCSVCKAEYCWWCGETWGFNYERHYSLLAAECCKGIQYEIFPWLASPDTAVRVVTHIGYYFSLVVVGCPGALVVLVVLSWVWAPALWRGEYKIRLQGLVRFIAIRFIQMMISIGYLVLMVFAFVFVILLDGLGWIIRQLRKLKVILVARTRQCCVQRRVPAVEKEAIESDLDSPAFVVFHDLEQGDVPDPHSSL